MRFAIFAAVLALCGCATAVNDSLDRRGVDARSLLAERLADARGDAARADATFAASADQLSAIKGLDGAALARRLDQAVAAGQDAALAAQDLRLSVGTANAAAGRYFRKKEDEIALMKTSAENAAAAQTGLNAIRAEDAKFNAAYEATRLRVSAALSLYDAETAALRRNATSRIAAEARVSERAAALATVAEAEAGLAALIDATDGYLGALKQIARP